VCKSAILLGLIVFAIPANVIPAHLLCWGSLILVGMILFGTAMLERQLTCRPPTSIFDGALGIGGIFWFILRVMQGTQLQWDGLRGDYWVPNLIGVSVAVLLFALGLFRFGLWF
jgi:hypothetical protein